MNNSNSNSTLDDESNQSYNSNSRELSWKKDSFQTSTMVIKTYNVQLVENLMYLGLHPPKHGKLYPFENFHYVNNCHLQIGQWVSQNFIPESKSCTNV